MKRLLPVLALLLLPVAARATWSIVVVDTATGELAIGTATCLPGIDIQQAVPVIEVGHGVAAAQAFVSANNKLTIHDGFVDGDTPAEILATLQATDPFHQGRQYGIVDLFHPPVGFTGTGVGQAKLHVTGEVGTLKYAVQGNVLVGPEVVTAAEAALLATDGDLGQRVMAAMEAARALGGDGRCSCTTGPPTSCGVPPPGFTKSAHVGTVIVSRFGDVDGPCTLSGGCAQGVYYLDLNVIGGVSDPDPVFTLQAQYDAWRTGMAGHPDGILSTKVAGAASLPADGLASTTVTVALADVEGAPLATGGATLAVTGPDGAPLLGSVGAVTDHGDGTYSFELVAGTTVGTEELAIAVDDGTVAATLYPWLAVELEAPAPLHCGFDDVPAGAGATVPFTIDLGAGLAGDPYVLVAGASGTSPGVPLAGGVAPLVPDAFTLLTLQAAGPPLLPGSSGVLDPAGRATAALVAPPGLLGPIVGLHLDWVAVSLGAVPTPTNADGFDVVP